jgi:hypothetical protein
MPLSLPGRLTPPPARGLEGGSCPIGSICLTECRLPGKVGAGLHRRVCRSIITRIVCSLIAVVLLHLLRPSQSVVRPSGNLVVRLMVLFRSRRFAKLKDLYISP